MSCYPCHLIDVNRLFSEKKRSFHILWFLRSFIDRILPKILLDAHLSDGTGMQLRNNENCAHLAGSLRVFPDR